MAASILILQPRFSRTRDIMVCVLKSSPILQTAHKSYRASRQLNNLKGKFSSGTEF